MFMTRPGVSYQATAVTDDIVAAAAAATKCYVLGAATFRLHPDRYLELTKCHEPLQSVKCVQHNR